MKVIFYTDAHRGTYRGVATNYEKLDLFCNRIEAEKPDVVLGGGDNYSLDWVTWKKMLMYTPCSRSIARQKYLASKFTWIEMLGNHNLKLKDFAADLYPVQVYSAPYIQLDGVWYTHGSQFDPTIVYWWQPLEHIFWKWMPWIYPRIFGSPSILKNAGRDKSYSKLVSLVESNAQDWAEGGETDKSLAFGHTHSEFIKHRSLHFLANAGDFVDSCSYLVVTDGVPELKWV